MDVDHDKIRCDECRNWRPLRSIGGAYWCDECIAVLEEQSDADPEELPDPRRHVFPEFRTELLDVVTRHKIGEQLGFSDAMIVDLVTNALAGLRQRLGGGS